MKPNHIFWSALVLWAFALSAVARADARPAFLDQQLPAFAQSSMRDQTHVAQTAPAQPVAPDTTTTPAPAQPDATTPPPPEPIGNVAKLTGSATVTRDNQLYSLSLQDDIYKNDVLQTSANSALDITFNDATTFSLTANSQIKIDEFVYADGGTGNTALFDIAKGTVAFVAAAVAKTGDMKIATPTASLGIRGTSGLVEVPEQQTGAVQRNVAIKLYPDADGKVGRIEVNGRDGVRLGLLSQGATGFAIRPGIGAGARFAAVPLLISPQQMLRDRGIVQRVHLAQTVGRQIVTQRRNDLRNGAGREPRLQRPPGLQRQPGLPRPNGLQRPGSPGLNAPAPQPRGPRQNDLQLRQPGLPAPSGVQPGALPPRQNNLPTQPGIQRQGTPALQQGPRQVRPLPRAAGPLRPTPTPRRKQTGERR
jgi:hypothetical protein